MSTDLHAEWGLRVRNARLGAGLTLQQLADKAGTTKAIVWNVENARSVPSDHLRVALAQALGVTTATLFAYPDQVGAA